MKLKDYVFSGVIIFSVSFGVLFLVTPIVYDLVMNAEQNTPTSEMSGLSSGVFYSHRYNDEIGYYFCHSEVDLSDEECKKWYFDMKRMNTP